MRLLQYVEILYPVSALGLGGLAMVCIYWVSR